jgi:hypothetical protein
MTIDKRARAMRGAEGLLATFIAQVPEEITEPDERRRRGIELRRAHLLMLGVKATEAKRRAREANQAKALSLPGVTVKRPEMKQGGSTQRFSRLARATRSDGTRHRGRTEAASVERAQ